MRQHLAELDGRTGRLFRRALRRPAGRPPLGVVGALLASGEAHSLGGYRELQPPTRVEVTDERLRRFLERQTSVPQRDGAFETEPVFLCDVARARFDPHSGALLTADDVLLVDSIKNDGRLKHVRLPVPDARSLAVHPGVFSSVASPVSGNYFHWLVESLPRLYPLEQAGERLTLLMPDTLGPLQRQMLDACLPASASLSFVPPGEWQHVERFVLPSYLTTIWDFAYPSAEALAYVRERVFAAVGVPREPGGGERIYISRARASVRHVTNEDEVLAVLEPLGFRRYFLEDLPFVEQVRLFHGAAAVVAPHGAGLANLLFAGRIPVLEFTSRVVTPVYFFLALALGQAYDYLYPVEIGDDAPLVTTAAGRAYSQARDQDITVDLDQLRAAVARLVRP